MHEPFICILVGSKAMQYTQCRSAIRGFLLVKPAIAKKKNFFSIMNKKYDKFDLFPNIMLNVVK